LKDQTHEDARRIVELYLLAKERAISDNNSVKFHYGFVKKHKLEKRYQGHSFDIVTPEEIIEIDDMGKHSKKNQKINDGIINEYAKEWLKPFKFYRLQKEEIVDRKGRLLDPKDVANYLRDNLF
jgi:hypothetical protein